MNKFGIVKFFGNFLLIFFLIVFAIVDFLFYFRFMASKQQSKMLWARVYRKARMTGRTRQSIVNELTQVFSDTFEKENAIEVRQRSSGRLKGNIRASINFDYLSPDAVTEIADYLID